MAYPASLDELTDGVPSDGAAPTTALDNATFPHDDHHRALAVAVEAVEAELGTAPSGSAATVVARLDTLDTTVAGKVGQALSTVAAAGSTETLAGDTYNIHDVTLDESVTFTFTTSAAVAQFTLILRQDGSGGNSVTWPASVKWHSLTAPTILTTASAVHVLEFLTVDTGTTWRGFLASSAVS